MILHELLGLPEREKHVVSLCGGGGKTTLMYALAREAKTLMPTALFTTTRIMAPSDADVILSVPFSKEECRAAWREGKIASSGTRLSEERKYGAPEEDTMRFLCREDCKGLCPVCGKDLNTELCTCPKGGKAGNPFSALSRLLTDQNYEEV